MNQKELPTDLQLAIKKGRDFDTGVGFFCHKDLKDVEVPIFIRSDIARATRFTDDPDSVLTGLYCTFAISILTAPNVPDVEGVPVWLPSLRRYGVWSEIYRELWLYTENTTWTDIERDLVRYTCSCTVKAPIVRTVLNIKNLSKLIDFIPDNLTDLIEVVMDLNSIKQREEALQELTSKLESILTRYPFSPELMDAYPVLCELYQKMGQLNNRRLKEPIEKDNAMQIIQWYEKCMPIIKQYIKYDLQLPSNITSALLLLSLWHSDVGNYSTAMRYINLYRKHHPEADDSYYEVKALIAQKKKQSVQN